MVGAFLIASGALGGCATSPANHTHSRNAAPDTPAAPSTAAAISTEGSAAATAAATRQVIAAEQGFARTMANRDFKAFVTFLSPDAVFFSGNNIQRGPAAIASQWETYFTGRQAPFSWAPDHVEVLTSGNLALSTGPMFQDNKIVGRFNSVWRLEAPNTWRIVFDKGEAVCGINP